MSDKFTQGIRAGSSGVSIDVVLRDTTGTEVTGKVYTDATVYYWRQGAAPVAVATATLASISAAWSSGGFKEADAANMPGSYRLDVPDAAFVAGVDWVEINVKVSGAMVYKERFGLTSEPVITGDAYALLIAGNTPVNVAQIASSTAAATNLSRAAQSTVLGVVASGSGTTSINTTSLDPAAVILDQFKGRVLIFDRSTTTAGLRGQGAPISGSSVAGVLTIAAANALTTSPVAGDTFTIT